MFKNRNWLFWLGLIASIVFFVTTLVFMTDFYNFFYDGTEETVAFYKQLQILNKYIFIQSLFVLVGMLIIFTGDFRKNHGSLLSSLILLILSVFSLTRTLTVIPTVQSFVTKFKTLDLPKNLSGGNQMMILDVTLVIVIIVTLILIALTIQSIILYFNQRTPKSKSGRVIHE